MTLKNDQFSADSLASDMESVMNSAEHKEMFKKEAQIAGAHQPGATTGISVPGGQSQSTSTQGKGGAGTVTQVAPGGPAGNIPSQVDPTKPIKSTTPTGTLLEQLQKVKDNPGLAGISGGEQLAAKILDGNASPDELTKLSPQLTGLLSAIGKPSSGGAAQTAMSELFNLNETQRLAKSQQKAIAPAISEVEMINTLVKMANLLGENEFVLSEAIADNLIQSIIVEAKKKDKKKKKMKKDECPECKCEPCECK